MKRTVWIVDDDEGIQEVTKIVLEEAGFDAHIVPDNTVLEEKLQSELPHLMLIDVTLSGVSGKDITKRLKMNRKTSGIPILILSGDSNIEAIVKDSGANGFIKKPYDIEELVDEVKKYLRS